MRHEATLTADGRSTAFPLKSPRGEGEAAILKTIFVTGTFGSGTVTVQISSDGSTWVDAEDDNGTAITFTADGAKNIKVSSDAEQPLQISFNLAGSTTPSLSFVVYENR